MSRHNDPIGVKIKTPITFMILGIPEKDTKSGARRELVFSTGRQVRITGTAKHTEMIVGWWSAMER
jgi:hypothetical protein